MKVSTYLGLEDKMTPQLSKAEKQAIANAKAIQQLDKETKLLVEQLKLLSDIGAEDTEVFEDLNNAIVHNAETMADYAEGTKKAKIENDGLSLSIIEANQALELLNKTMQVFNTLQQEASKWVKESENQFNAEVTAAVKMRNMMGMDNADIQSMYDYASALQEVTIMGDEAIVSASGILATSASNKDSLMELTKAAVYATEGLNGTAASQSTLESTASSLERALESGASMLVRQKVLTKEQADYIDSLNDKQQKESELARLVTANFSSANDMLVQSAYGGIAQANNKLSDLQETLGQKVVPYMNTFKQIIVSIVTPIAEFINQNEWLIPVLGSVGIAIGALITILTTYITITKIAELATKVFGASQAALLGPIGLVILAIAALGGYLLYLWNTNDEAAYGMLKTWDNFLIGIKMMALGLKSIGYDLLNFFEDTGANFLKIIESCINGAIGLINWFLSKLNLLPGVSIDLISYQSTIGTRAAAQAAADKAARESDLYKDAMAIQDMIEEQDRTRWDRVNNRNKSTSIDSLLQDTVDSVLVPGVNGGKALNVSTGNSDGLLSDEDVQLLLDMTTRQLELNYQQITPSIALTFGDIHETADVEGIIENIVDELQDVYDSDLEVIPE